jgi:hypothetical protein
MLAQARATFHAHERPRFVAYTLARREFTYDIPDFENTYTVRIWYRAADRTALSRRLDGKRATGALHFTRPAFNEPVDPGPPTGDIFELAPPRPGTAPEPAPSEPLRTIATLAIAGQLDYRARFAGVEDGAYHLELTAYRDPERNRLRDIWIDPVSFETRRVRANDRLFLLPTGLWVPDLFDVYLEMRDGLPVIRRIESTTDVDSYAASHGPHFRAEYRFDDIAFPASLPDWYFQPKTYRAHASEAPAA